MKQQTLQLPEQQIERALRMLKGYLERAQDHANRQARPLGHELFIVTQSLHEVCCAAVIFFFMDSSKDVTTLILFL